MHLLAYDTLKIMYFPDISQDDTVSEKYRKWLMLHSFFIKDRRDRLCLGRYCWQLVLFSEKFVLHNFSNWL